PGQPPAAIYPLSLHDALPIYLDQRRTEGVQRRDQEVAHRGGELHGRRSAVNQRLGQLRAELLDHRTESLGQLDEPRRQGLNGACEGATQGLDHRADRASQVREHLAQSRQCRLQHGREGSRRGAHDLEQVTERDADRLESRLQCAHRVVDVVEEVPQTLLQLGLGDGVSNAVQQFTHRRADDREDPLEGVRQLDEHVLQRRAGDRADVVHRLVRTLKGADQALAEGRSIDRVRDALQSVTELLETGAASLAGRGTERAKDPARLIGDIAEVLDSLDAGVDPVGELAALVGLVEEFGEVLRDVGEPLRQARQLACALLAQDPDNPGHVTRGRRGDLDGLGQVSKHAAHGIHELEGQVVGEGAEEAADLRGRRGEATLPLRGQAVAQAVDRLRGLSPEVVPNDVLQIRPALDALRNTPADILQRHGRSDQADGQATEDARQRQARRGDLRQGRRQGEEVRPRSQSCRAEQADGVGHASDQGQVLVDVAEQVTQLAESVLQQPAARQGGNLSRDQPGRLVVHLRQDWDGPRPSEPGQPCLGSPVPRLINLRVDVRRDVVELVLDVVAEILDPDQQSITGLAVEVCTDGNLVLLLQPLQFLLHHQDLALGASHSLDVQVELDVGDLVELVDVVGELGDLAEVGVVDRLPLLAVVHRSVDLALQLAHVRLQVDGLAAHLFEVVAKLVDRQVAPVDVGQIDLDLVLQVLGQVLQLGPVDIDVDLQVLHGGLHRPEGSL